MSNLVILKWKAFEYKAKFEKEPSLFRSKVDIFDIFLIFNWLFFECMKKFLKIWKSIVIQNFKPVPLCPISPLNLLGNYAKCCLLIANIIKGTISALRHFWELKTV